MDTEKKIAPCPFSRHYLIPEKTAWQSLTVYLYYRLILASALTFLFFTNFLPASIGKYNPGLYGIASSLYLASVFLAATPLILRHPSYSRQAQLQVFTDIVMIPLLMHASGGVSSGVGMLLVLSVAAGGILIGGRCAVLFAALASLGVLAETAYAVLYRNFDETHFVYAGMLGASYFAIAILALTLAERTEKSEALAMQRGIDLANLEQINEFVIRYLQSGILVLDEHHHIRMSNESAERLLGLGHAGGVLDLEHPALAELLDAWLKNPARATASLATNGHLPIHVRFTRPGRANPPIYMIFVEDSALYNERVQQAKLASLGRLTASIAHEIRNPLSAINHASQLLAEVPGLDAGDQRLTRIIQDHVLRVNAIIENVLQISRRGQTKRESIPLAATVAALLQEFQDERGLPGGTFLLDARAEQAQVSIDPSHLKQILENLWSNALKYGDSAHGPILVRVLRKKGEPGVEVVDHAPPIDPLIAQQMFEPFFTTSATGTGLGLYIARELAEMNQARLEYAGEGGGCFHLYLADAERTVVAL